MPAQSTVTKRQASAERTRERMIDAGLLLAEQTSLAELSVNLIVAEAGVAKGSFFHHFGDRTGYLIALHRRFHEELLLATRLATENVQPGRERLRVGAIAYLDVCLRGPGGRALVLEARAEPVIVDEVVARTLSNAKLLVADFRALGRKYPLPSARLWLGLVAEAALVELEAGRRNPAVRSALVAFITTS
ncbi:MAG TPA: TetR/AcrR family transcriptional regulator [Solirubrobacteraceae bacterium]|jgi:AcrR family transcriptional regulator